MAGVYRPRHPERTVLNRVLSHHFDRFLAEYETRFEREYGFFRPIVFTIPKMLRVFFKYRRRLLGDLCRCALRALTCYFEVATGSALTPGVTAAIQTFGDRINLHVHLHFLVTEGGVDAAGVFQKIPRMDDSRLAEIFAREVLAMLVRKGLLSQEWTERILSWRHTGFNVHSLMRAKTKPEAERVDKYMIRPLLSLERLSFLELAIFPDLHRGQPVARLFKPAPPILCYLFLINKLI